VSLLKTLKAVSWLAIISIVVLTIVPADGRPVTGLQSSQEHLLAFGFTGLTIGFAYSTHPLVNLLSAVGFTLLLELGQIPLSTRHARFEDFIVDACAACLGVLIACACRYFFRRLFAAF
jgi:VanZ family protein